MELVPVLIPIIKWALLITGALSLSIIAIFLAWWCWPWA